ncbi:hypothetical protein GCM10028807_43950 [Spirosoma daeguense]
MEVPLLSRAVSVRSILFFLLSLATLLLSGFVPIWAKTKPRAFDRTLFAYIQSINRTTGAVVLNGGDSQAVYNFTFKWGDGTSTDGFFPQNKTYTNVDRNRVVKVISNYPNGQKDSVIVLVEFVTPIISTVAGPTNIGDNGPATLATLNDPEAVAVDAAGNTYITEGVANRIRKISPDGIITTLAGTGKPGFSGDGGPATAALINYPTSIAVDASGTIYFSDWYNNRIRKISTSGIITTAAGNGTLGFSGDGGLATAAALGGAYGIAVATNGVIYIADWNNQRIRKVGTDGVITTIAGNGTAGFSGDNGSATLAQLRNPSGVAVDASGNVYIGDYGNWRIRKVATNGIITTIAGNGTQGSTGDNGSATSAQISFFAGPLVDASGNVYITSFFNNQIRKVSTNGTITRVTGLANGAGYYNGDGIQATDAALASPLGLAIASGNLFIADRGNQRIRKVNTSGIISTIAGPNNAGFSGDGGLATSARLNSPIDVKGDGNGNFFFAETSIGRIRKVDAGGIVTTVAGMSLAGFSGDSGPATSARLAIPYGILPDGNGNFYIADTYNNRIRKVNTDGIITTIAGNGTAGFGGDNGPATNAQLKLPYNVALDKAGNLYIADSDNNRIRKINTNGAITTIVGTGIAGYGGDGGSATSAQLNFPTGLALDAANNLYISDNRNHRIRRVTPGGIISTIAGTGTAGYSGSNDLAVAAQLSYPFGIAVSGNGTVYFSDNGNVRVRRIGTDGIIMDVAGTATRGFLGDDAPATQAQLGNPFGIGLDGYGNLLIADNANARIRKIACIDPPTVSLIASSTNVCVGDVVSISAITSTSASTNTYVWSGSTPIVSSTAGSALASPAQGTNTYTVVVTNAGGCTGTASITLQAVPLQTVKAGSWNDPTVWSCGRIPAGGDNIQVRHLITIPGSFTANSYNVTYSADGSLRFGSESLLKISAFNSSIQLFPSVKMVSDNVNQLLTTINDTQLIFSADSRVNEFNVNDILVSGITNNAPNGYLRKITGITVADGKIILTTRHATLNELIKSGNFKTVSDLSTTESSPASLQPQTNVIRTTSLESGIVLYDLDGNPSTTEDQFKIQGKLDNKFTGLINMDFANDFSSNPAGETKLSYFIAKYDVASELAIQVTIPSVENPVIPEKELAEYRLPPIRIPGLLFLPIRPVVSLKGGIKFTGKVDLPIQTFVKMKTNGSLGFEYKNGQNSLIHTSDSVLDSEITGFRQEAFSVNAEIKPYIKTEVKFTLFDHNYSYIDRLFKAEANASVGIELAAHLKATVSPGNSLQLCTSIDQQAYAGVKFSLLDANLIDAQITGFYVPYYKERCWTNTTVTTQQVSNIFAKSAQVQGIVQKYKSGNLTHYGICYSSTAATPTITHSKAEFTVESTPPDNKTFSAEITGLDENRRYYARAYAKTAVGTVIYGDVLSFTTTTAPQVTATTLQASNVASTSALVQGIIDNYSVDNVTSYGVCYSPTATQPTVNDALSSILIVNASTTTSRTYTASLKNLTPNKTHYARAYAMTPTGPVYGSPVSFTPTFGENEEYGYFTIDGVTKITGIQSSSSNPVNSAVLINTTLGNSYAQGGWIRIYESGSKYLTVDAVVLKPQTNPRDWNLVGSYSLASGAIANVESNYDGLRGRSKYGNLNITRSDGVWLEGNFNFVVERTGNAPDIVVTNGYFKVKVR